VAELGAAGVPAGEVRSVPGALRQTAEAGRPVTVTVSHPKAGELQLVGSPIWGAAGREPEPPPLLGQHTAQVLEELGRSHEEIRELADRGVVALGGA
jgi:crotonobetainyl-CoA:carnitine CoA-transferase CaiB-like acyl-CoA transferase